MTVPGFGLVGWYQVKQFLEHSSGFSMDALHVIAGVLIQLGAAWLLRRSLADWRPFLVVLAVELANEINDFRVERWPEPAMQYGEGARDIALTLLLPLVLLVLARIRPQLFTGRAPAARAKRSAKGRA